LTSGAELATSIESEIAALGTRQRAEGEKAYLKSDLEFLGATVGAIRQIIREIKREHPNLSHAKLLATIRALWRRPVHECRAAAVDLLMIYRDLLRPDDLKLLEQLLRRSKTWALVDYLATAVVGDLLDRYPALNADMDRWAKDDDFWIRRSALLAHLGSLRRGEGDFERWATYADAMLEEKEFFIRKAIGWVLRDTARKRPDMIYEWLLPRAHRASGVTVREAVKRMSDTQKRAIMAEYQRS